MTEREPNPLYDALRERLADYGQEPPAQLWAGIRAKLPPPVAQPQLRRRRRWSPVLLLCLLLTVAGTAGWQWWRTAGQGATTATIARTSASKKEGADAAATTASSAGQPSTQAPARPAQAGAEKAAGTGLEDAQLAVASATVPSEAASGAAAATTAAGPTATTRRKPNGRRDALAALAGNTASRRNSATPGLLTDVGAQTRAGRTALPGREDGLPGTAALTTPAATGAPTPTATLAPAAATSGDVPSADGVAGAVGTRTTEVPATSTSAANLPTAADITSTNLVAPKTATVAQLPYPEPVVLARPDTTRLLPSVVTRRWAALVLAGPAVTYRKLGNGSQNDYVPFPNVPSNNPTFSSFRDANAAATEETSGVGFGVQVQVRRQLSGRWGLSTGLGYQEYATQTTVTAASAADIRNAPGSSNIPPLSPPTTLVETKHRDTYRFVTVPVRLSYALGHPAGRFRYGMLAGLDAALYVGGASPAANGQIKTWDATGSQYRSLSAAFIAGLDLRYRVVQRWDVVAQPTATYFLNSLGRPTSGLTPRYLLGAGVQLGVSYDFR